ncbi:ribonuclease J [Candidatus Peregrinibacteria bacterium CG08_land_8_20_14_0_20_41_10]|nr:MAG: ribonuclease J [Candidatus Peregrinibacteria bacterium CG08_land_8_20_14_0_20_41_10]
MEIEKWLKKVLKGEENPSALKQVFTQTKLKEETPLKKSEQFQKKPFSKRRWYDKRNNKLRKVATGPGNPHLPHTTSGHLPAVNKPVTRNLPVKHGVNLSLHGHVTHPQTKRPNFDVTKFPSVDKTQVTKPADFNLRVVPLGGCDHTGALNMMMLETPHEILVIDAGLGFPEEDMLGVDYMIPDISYLKEHKAKLKGILITHGHLDHYGALPHFLKELDNPPVYSTAFARELILQRLKEFKLDQEANLILAEKGKSFSVGNLKVLYIHTNHSIPDTASIAIDTPEGVVYFSGDFKFDETPEKEAPADKEVLLKLQKRGVALLVSDSLNSEIPGRSVSERVINHTFQEIFAKAKKRLIVAAFASNMNRFQQIVDAAQAHHRKIFLTGRSLIQNFKITQKLGYLKLPKDLLVNIKSVDHYQDEEILILATGSQGEDYAALTRIAAGTHLDVKIKKGDTVVLSSSIIPGNELSVQRSVNSLGKMGAHIVQNNILAVHTSGHGCQEDKLLLLKFLQPRYFLPYHGEFYFRNLHAELAEKGGFPEQHIFMLNDGDALEFRQKQAYLHKEAVKIGRQVVEGTRISDEGSWVLRERQIMAEEGIVVLVYKINKTNRKLLGAPKLFSKGFIYQEESQSLPRIFSQEAKRIYEEVVTKNGQRPQKEIIHEIRSTMQKVIRKKLDKEPIVLPVIIEI